MKPTHAISAIVGAAIIAAATHVSIASSVGYAASAAVLQIAVACGLIAGSIALGVAIRERRRGIVIAMGFALLAGELVVLINTAERSIAARDASQAPLVAVEASRVAAAGRLARAETAKAEFDKASLATLAEKGCRKECRSGIDRQSTDLAAEVAAARTALANVPAARSPSPLAERLGVAPWLLDLIAAGAASIAANGLGAALIAFGTHAQRQVSPKAATGAPVSAVAAVSLVALLPPPRDAALEPRNAPVEPRELRSASLGGSEPRNASLEPREPRNASLEADRFARATFRPDRESSVRLIELRAAYRQWCVGCNLDPLPDVEIGAALATLFERVGLYRVGSGATVAIQGIAFTSTSARRSAAA